MRILLFVMSAFLIYAGYQEGVFDSLIAEASLRSKDFSSITCADLHGFSEGQHVTYRNGSSAEILSVGGLEEVTRTSTTISCSGLAQMSSGMPEAIIVQALKDSRGRTKLAIQTVSIFN
jgi:hypothetical protein